MKELQSSIDKELVLHILQKIQEAIETIQKRTINIHCGDDFALSPSGMEKLDAACMLLIAIGESVKNLDKVTGSRLLPTYPSVPWKQVMGMRDIIAHHYFDVDADVVYQVIHDDLNPLLDAIGYFRQEIKQ